MVTGVQAGLEDERKWMEAGWRRHGRRGEPLWVPVPLR